MSKLLEALDPLKEHYPDIAKEYAFLKKNKNLDKERCALTLFIYILIKLSNPELMMDKRSQALQDLGKQYINQINRHFFPESHPQPAQKT